MYWVAVASREHVKKGMALGFCQVCHGKAGPLKQMKANDWIVYYSPKEKFGEKLPCQKFTALGQVLPKDPYQFQMSIDFAPWRRDIAFLDAKEAPIEPLIDKLEFIQNKKHWGFVFRRGCFPISLNDFQTIVSSMEVILDTQD